MGGGEYWALQRSKRSSPTRRREALPDAWSMVCSTIPSVCAARLWIPNTLAVNPMFTNPCYEPCLSTLFPAVH